jgi:hypothetical protein
MEFVVPVVDDKEEFVYEMNELIQSYKWYLEVLLAVAM